jgi:prepilin-type N-terminal cleavage/methylation domain-containing protein
MKKFTLIELLVVVAIIGILTSMLIPSLKKAREEGKKAVCKSNLKQVGIAIQLYIDENNDYFPPMQTGSHKYGWLGKLGTGSIYEQTPKERLLNMYVLGDWPPADDDEVAVAECLSGSELYNETGSSYPANTSGNMPKTLFENSGSGATKWKHSKNFSDIQTPTKFVTMAEHGAFKSAQGSTLEDSWYFHTTVGDGRWNLLFGDAHVTFQSISSGAGTTDDYTFRRDR